MKELYKFTVREDVEGEDPIMHQVLIAKPNRRQIEEADMEYSVALSECVSNGVLTKAMLAKKYSDTGGLMSEDEAKHLFDLYKDIVDLGAEYSQVKTLGKKTKANQKKLEDIQEKLTMTRREVVEMETNYQSLFNHTADIKAQNAIIRWYALHLVHVFDQEKSEYLPYFDAPNYEAKEEQYYAREDSEDNETYFRIMTKAGSIISLWFFNNADTPDEIKELLTKIGIEADDEEEVEEEVPEEKPKPARKRAKRKTAPKKVDG